MKLTNEIKIALVAIVGILVLFFGLNFLKGMSFFSTDSTYYVAFKDISGLSSSNPIYADGYKVGVVKSIQYNYAKKGDVLVQIDINPDLRIPKGSSAEIESDLMGNVKMNLLLANNPRERVNKGDTIIGSKNSGMLGNVAKLLPTVQQMLPKLDSILSSVNTLLADPALAHSLHNIEGITANLNTTSQQLNTLVAGVNRQVPSLLRRADGVMVNANTFTGNLAQVDIAGTMAQVNQTIAQLNAFSQQLNSKEGSLGLLMHDPALYNNLNKTMASADSLLINVRQHPKRYVHFSLFGRKDK
ncbi:MlaD family protein [Segatella oulorum]|uniref:MlaD family protein n=1 Tax=Segatella oulorum TaxID=28136 RepID=UPI0023F50BB5|nr:MlaD family protein [Segatella oulorum]